MKLVTPVFADSSGGTDSSSLEPEFMEEMMKSNEMMGATEWGGKFQLHHTMNNFSQSSNWFLIFHGVMFVLIVVLIVSAIRYLWNRGGRK